MPFNDTINDIRKKIEELLNNPRPHLRNEENTKNYLIFPLIEALGYRTSDINQVQAEYPCNLNFNNGHIDIVLLHDNLPSIIIECKPITTQLGNGKWTDQLFRYFSVVKANENNCHLAVLTNGCEYLFFSDLEQDNVLDNDYFLKIDLSNDDSDISFFENLRAVKL